MHALGFLFGPAHSKRPAIPDTVQTVTSDLAAFVGFAADIDAEPEADVEVKN